MTLIPSSAGFTIQARGLRQLSPLQELKMQFIPLGRMSGDCWHLPKLLVIMQLNVGNCPGPDDQLLNTGAALNS